MDDKSRIVYLMNKLGFHISDIKDSDKGFDARIRIQKLVFFAKSLGADFSYSFSMYLHGPYSPDLTRDYYSLKNEDFIVIQRDSSIDNIMENLKILNEQETVWLETAATILDVKKSNPRLHWKDIISHVSNIKSEILKQAGKDSEYVNSVKDDLKKLNLIFN